MNTKDDGYAIWRHVLSDSGVDTVITLDDYNTISRAADVRREIADIEEKFHIICENYRELEELVFSVNMKNMIYDIDETAHFFVIKAEFNRKLLSLLSSSRLYIDSVERHAEQISNSDVSMSDVKKVMSGIYDNNFSYRAIESIRNYAQHHALPVQSASYGAKWGDNFETNNYRSEFFFELESIWAHGKFKAEIFNEINSMGGKIELLRLIREYFANMCDAHAEFRNKFQKYALDSMRVFSDMRTRWKQVQIVSSRITETLVGVVVGRLQNGIVDDAVPLINLSIQSDEYKEFLLRRTRSIMKMGLRRVVW